MSEKVRNFVIIAHIDHGKSTLADRFLELTGTVEARKMHAQFLDQMDLEREKGITIKMQPVRMLWHSDYDYGDDNDDGDDNGNGNDDDDDSDDDDGNGGVAASHRNGQRLLSGSEFVLNLIDTPGHADFRYEVSRALAAVEGAIILVDATQGVQAQTLANLNLARAQGLCIIPAINKIDLPNAMVEESRRELAGLLGFSSEDVFLISAKTGEGVYELLEAVVRLVPPPGNRGFNDLKFKDLSREDGGKFEDPKFKNLSEGGEKFEDEKFEELNGEDDTRFKDLKIEGLEHENLDFERAAQGEPRPGRALIFDSQFDAYRGIIAHVRVFNGTFSRASKIRMLATAYDAEITELGYFLPALQKTDRLFSGEIGYIATGIKEPNAVRVGDTIIEFKSLKFKDLNRNGSSEFSKSKDLNRTGDSEFNKSKELNRDGDNAFREFKDLNRGGDNTFNKSEDLNRDGENKFSKSKDLSSDEIEPLPGYREPKPVVFASVFPEDPDDYEKLKDALGKMRLNDAAFVYEPERSDALGRGFRLGFLGMLHMEIVGERLRREYGIGLIFVTPSVAYHVELRNGRKEFIYSAARIPDEGEIAAIFEPWVRMEVIVPERFFGNAMKLLSATRGMYASRDHIGSRIAIRYEAPLSDVLVEFFDDLKSETEGYGSFSYEMLEYRPGDLARLDILIAGEREEALSRVVPRARAYADGRLLTAKLKELLPKQLFAVSVQAAIGSRVLARETIPAMKKDVTGYLYGGDRTRKMKLWKKQQRGKKRLRAEGRVEVPPEVFLKLLKR